MYCIIELNTEKGADDMSKVAVLLAEGFEELEAIAIVDVLRRAGIEVTLSGLHAGPIESARKVKVIPDSTVDGVTSDDYDMVVLPGGLPGADNLNADARVQALLKDFHTKGKLTGAICAAPYVLANAGILDGKRATAYPGFGDRLGTALYEESTVVCDGTVLTSRGPGTALCFALAIVERLSGKEKAQQIKEAMLVTYCD
jgi:4-methyl-5(b-hydroxyethyl)-thiazole monophosphate biosynthesis